MALSGNLTAAIHDPTALGRDFKARLRCGEVLVGGILAEHLRPSMVKLYAQAGFDFLYIENEHALFDPTALADTISCARDNKLPTIAKTTQLERPEISKLVCAGVVGVQLPRTESREQVLTLIDYLKYPPLGTRAGDPGWGGTDYTVPAAAAQWLESANEAMSVVAMIETKTGYLNAESIISTPGVDMLYVGPYDFSISMGYPGDYDNPAVRRPMEEILEICKANKVAFGTTASGIEAAKIWIELGTQFFQACDELSFIRDGATQLVSNYQRLIGGR